MANHSKDYQIIRLKWGSVKDMSEALNRMLEKLDTLPSPGDDSGPFEVVSSSQDNGELTLIVARDVYRD